MKLVQGKQVAIKHIWYNRYVALYYNKIELNLTHTPLWTAETWLLVIRGQFEHKMTILKNHGLQEDVVLGVWVSEFTMHATCDR